MILRFFRFLLGTMALATVALIAALTTMRFAIHGAEVSVPDLAGLTIPEAARKTSLEGLNLNVENRFYSAEVPSGHILAQSPAVGTVVRREWHVRVTESLGPQRIAIPNVVGQRERTAAIYIHRIGLELGSQVYLPTTSAQPDTVIAQSPPANATGVDRPRVSLLISQQMQQPAISYVMPDFAGQNITAALQAVLHAGLKLAPVQEAPLSIPAVAEPGQMAAPQPATAPGTIIAQSPAAGYVVSADQPIQFTVAH
ncbi:MAG: PASTA domain-containing protein [Acidobacteriaceae bacterium]